MTVSLRPLTPNFNWLDLTIEWIDPGACNNQYLAAVYDSERFERVINYLGFYPAPATTSITAETCWLWEMVSDDGRWVGVSCVLNNGNHREVGKVALEPGLPPDE